MSERKWTKTGLAVTLNTLGLLAVLVFFLWRDTQPSSQVISSTMLTQSLRVVDSAGKTRLILDGGAGERGGDVVSLLAFDGSELLRFQALISRPGEVRVSLFDDAGTERWSFTMLEDGTAVVNAVGITEGTLAPLPVLDELPVD